MVLRKEIGMEFKLGEKYQKIYTRLCGYDTDINVFHFQWLPVYEFHRELKKDLEKFSGRCLDLGCGKKPYSKYLTNISEHIGADVKAGEYIDFVVDLNTKWPLDSNQFDSIVCTEVIEYIPDLRLFTAEMNRVLKPEGVAVITCPFIYNMHGIIKDYWRYSTDGIAEIFKENFEIVKLKTVGGIGSTLGLLWLNFLMVHKINKILKIALPIWLVISVVTNLIGMLLDKLDNTNKFYHHSYIIVKKIG